MRKIYKLLIVVAAFLAISMAYRGATAPTGHRISISDPIDPSVEPRQSDVIDAQTIEVELDEGEATLTPAANYSVDARISGRKSYRGTWQAQVSRFDLLLLWGDLATQDISVIEFKQEGRWYYYYMPQYSGFTVDYIQRHAANTHIIPANKNLYRAVSRLKKGDVVRLEGFLVDLDGKYKGNLIWWDSSRTRDDTGNGACELLYLTSLTKGDRVYK